MATTSSLGRVKPLRRKPRPSSRTALVRVRLTRKERQSWQSMADALGATLSDLVRAKVNGAALHVREQADPALINQVRRVGLTLNQLARIAHGGGTIDQTRLTAALEAAQGLFQHMLADRTSGRA